MLMSRSYFLRCYARPWRRTPRACSTPQHALNGLSDHDADVSWREVDKSPRVSVDTSILF